MISRGGKEFTSFRRLNEPLLEELKVQSPVSNGEIVCLNDTGNTELRNRLLRRSEERFVAFDLRSTVIRSKVTEKACSNLPARMTWKELVAKREFDPSLPNQAS